MKKLLLAAGIIGLILILIRPLERRQTNQEREQVRQQLRATSGPPLSIEERGEQWAGDVEKSAKQFGRRWEKRFKSLERLNYEIPEWQEEIIVERLLHNAPATPGYEYII